MVPVAFELSEERSDSEWSEHSESVSGSSIFPAGADLAPTKKGFDTIPRYSSLSIPDTASFPNQTFLD